MAQGKGETIVVCVNDRLQQSMIDMLMLAGYRVISLQNPWRKDLEQHVASFKTVKAVAAIVEDDPVRDENVEMGRRITTVLKDQGIKVLGLHYHREDMGADARIDLASRPDVLLNALAQLLATQA